MALPRQDLAELKRIGWISLVKGGTSTATVGSNPVNAAPRFPTSIQNIALDLVFEVVGEERIDRSREEYIAIAARLPPLKVLHFQINERLKELHRGSRDRLYEICRYKKDDRRIVYQAFPKSISYETLRAALTTSGMRPQRRLAKSK